MRWSVMCFFAGFGIWTEDQAWTWCQHYQDCGEVQIWQLHTHYLQLSHQTDHGTERSLPCWWNGGLVTMPRLCLCASELIFLVVAGSAHGKNWLCENVPTPPFPVLNTGSIFVGHSIDMEGDILDHSVNIGAGICECDLLESRSRHPWRCPCGPYPVLWGWWKQWNTPESACCLGGRLGANMEIGCCV